MNTSWSRASAKPWFIAYLVAFIVLLLLDALWLGAVARDFYRREFGSLMADTIRFGPAALFYLLYPLALVYFAFNPRPASLLRAAGRAAAVGLLAYGTYDLTNLSTLRGWSIGLTLIDLAWGVFASASAGLLSCWFSQIHQPGLPTLGVPRGPERQRLS